MALLSYFRLPLFPIFGFLTSSNRVGGSHPRRTIFQRRHPLDPAYPSSGRETPQRVYIHPDSTPTRPAQTNLFSRLHHISHQSPTRATRHTILQCATPQFSLPIWMTLTIWLIVAIPSLFTPGITIYIDVHPGLPNFGKSDSLAFLDDWGPYPSVTAWNFGPDVKRSGLRDTYACKFWHLLAEHPYLIFDRGRPNIFSSPSCSLRVVTQRVTLPGPHKNPSVAWLPSDILRRPNNSHLSGPRNLRQSLILHPSTGMPTRQTRGTPKEAPAKTSSSIAKPSPYAKLPANAVSVPEKTLPKTRPSATDPMTRSSQKHTSTNPPPLTYAAAATESHEELQLVTPAKLDTGMDTSHDSPLLQTDTEDSLVPDVLATCTRDNTIPFNETSDFPCLPTSPGRGGLVTPINIRPEPATGKPKAPPGDPGPPAIPIETALPLHQRGGVHFAPGTSHGQSTSVTEQPTRYLFILAHLEFKEKTMSCIQTSLSAILKGLQELQVHFQVCGYDPAEKMPPVTKIATIGSNLSQLTRYFNRLRLAKTSWTYWRVSWVPPFPSYTLDQFLLDCNAILSGHHGRFFEKRLQVPYSATAGWLFKSTDKLDKEALHEFLQHQLALRNFTAPIALYSKEPFKGNAQPDSASPTKGVKQPKPQDSDWTAGLAIHIDTLDGSEIHLYQKLRMILSSKDLSNYTNFKWTLFPPYHNDLPRKDKTELAKAIAKQRNVLASLFSISTNSFIDPDDAVHDNVSIRTFLLAQLSPQGDNKKLILSIDRDKRQPDHFILTCGRWVNPATKVDMNAEALTFLVHFLPIYLFRYFGSRIRTHLTAEGLLNLEDQYWCEDTDSPSSRHSEHLQAAHMDDSDFTIVMVDTVPEEFCGIKRPSSDQLLDFDEITQASFNTQGQAKAPRISEPSSVSTTRVVELEAVCQQQQEQLAALQEQFQALLHRQLPSSPAAGPSSVT